MERSRDAVRFSLVRALIGIAGIALCGPPLVPATSLAGPACDIDNCGAFSGPVTCADGRHVSAPFHCNDLCQNPSQDVGKQCATFDGNPCAEAVCGSAGECGNAQTYVPPSCNDNNDCTIDTCDACANNCGGACVHTPDVSSALGGPVTCADGRHVTAPFHCNDLCQNPSQDVGKLCATFDGNLCLEAVCGSAGECGNAKLYIPAGCDDGDGCTIDTCDPCANNRVGACGHQQDVSATGCSRATGEACTSGSQCASTHCTDGVCCSRACDGAFEACDLPGHLGQCTAPAPAPAVSGRGVPIVAGLLTVIGLLGLRRAVWRTRR